MEECVACKFQAFGCGAILDSSDEADHYTEEAEAHINLLMLKLKIEAQNALIHKKAHQKALVKNKELEKRVKALEAKNAELKQVLDANLQVLPDQPIHPTNSEHAIKETSRHPIAYQANSGHPILPTHNSLVTMLYRSQFATEPSTQTQQVSRTQTDVLNLDVVNVEVKLPTPRDPVDHMQANMQIFQNIRDPLKPRWKPSFIPRMRKPSKPPRNAPASLPAPLPAPFRALTEDPLAKRTNNELLDNLQRLQAIHNGFRDVSNPDAFTSAIMNEIEKQEMKTRGQLALRKHLEEYKKASELVENLPRLDPNANTVCETTMGKVMIPREIRTKIQEISEPPRKCPIPNLRLPLPDGWRSLHDMFLGKSPASPSTSDNYSSSGNEAVASGSS